ncbi:MAG: AB hydrolase superfamily protein YdjP [Alphaproteobacteria bacterium MarineAlpha2_Bin1]|nr:MAG: AB hydrolase superfamily protein YdjP [Alphaproteobacteria bacterium MarineAlpha2_Bin1]
MQFCEGYDEEKIAFYDKGSKDNPVLLFIHGFSQSSLCWKKQYTSNFLSKFRQIRIDMRGHGSSSKPQNQKAYNNHIPYAHDINAVIRTLDLENIIPVCWSMGGNWICDYMREFGQDKFKGIIFVGATTQQGTPITENFFGKGAIENLNNLFNPDTKINIQATKAFILACRSGMYEQEDFEEILSYNMIVSPQIRQWVLDRISDNSDIIKNLKIPILQIHGDEDKVVLPFAGDYTIEQVNHNNKELKLYTGVGHSPFFETPDIFNKDLANFASEVL